MSPFYRRTSCRAAPSGAPGETVAPRHVSDAGPGTGRVATPLARRARISPPWPPCGRTSRARRRAAQRRRSRGPSRGSRRRGSRREATRGIRGYREESAGAARSPTGRRGPSCRSRPSCAPPTRVTRNAVPRAEPRAPGPTLGGAQIESPGDARRSAGGPSRPRRTSDLSRGTVKSSAAAGRGASSRFDSWSRERALTRRARRVDARRRHRRRPRDRGARAERGTSRRLRERSLGAALRRAVGGHRSLCGVCGQPRLTVDLAARSCTDYRRRELEVSNH